MEEKVDILELLLRPAFCVQDGRITQVNREAARYLICVDTPICELIRVGLEEYQQFTGGHLCLTLQIEGQALAASVLLHDHRHIFILEQDAMDAQLQSMALAAQELRSPLAGMMTAADQLLPAAAQANPSSQKHAAQMNRRLFQMLRIVSNMSDAAKFASTQPPAMEYADINALFHEIFMHSAPLAAQSQQELRFCQLQEPVWSLANSEQLERAVYNLISNAMKFSPAGSVIDAKLVRRGNYLRFTIEDAGCGIDPQIQGSIFSRYLRTPSLEDPRYGLGLGMVLVRLAATAHNGTVLIDHPNGKGTRVTMTMRIRQDSQSTVRSPRLRIDYAGERDHALVELSDVLDASLYETKNIN